MALATLRLNIDDITGPGRVGEILIRPLSSSNNTAAWTSTKAGRIPLSYRDPIYASTDPAYAPDYTKLDGTKYPQVTQLAYYEFTVIRVNNTKDGTSFTAQIPASATVDFDDLIEIPAPIPSPIDLVDGAVAAVVNAPLTGAALDARALVAAPGAPSTAKRSDADRAGDYVTLDDFYLAADNDDWSLTLARALAFATPLRKAVRLTKTYGYKTTCTLNDHDAIVGGGERTGFAGPTNAPVRLFTATSKTSIKLDNFKHHGGLQSGAAAMPNIRGMVFSDCSNIAYTNMHGEGIADWGTAFIRCTNVRAERYTHHGGGQGDPGGRDGLHFLDCSKCTIRTVRGWSGDDLVGITTETVGTSDMTISDVAGESDLGSLVIVNEEGSTTFPAARISIDNVRNGYFGGATIARNLVRVYTINVGTAVSDITISNVKGIAGVSYGVWASGNSGTPLTNLRIVDCDVTSNSVHGIYCAYVTGFTIDAAGKSSTGLFDGIQLNHCTTGNIKPKSIGSSFWGLNVQNSTNVIIDSPMILNCGGNRFSSSNGGGIQVVSSPGTVITGGISFGDPTTSYYALRWTGTSPKVNGTALSAANIYNSAPSSDIASPILRVYKTTGTTTWTKPTGLKYVEAVCVPSGGTGGGGAQQAAGVAAFGGGGGAGGAVTRAIIDAALLSTTEDVVVGASPTGGAGATSASGNGTAGNGGQVSSFGDVTRGGVFARPGGGGAAGTTSSGNGGTGGGQSGGASSATATAGSGGSSLSMTTCAGGGAGAGISTANVAQTAGSGGASGALNGSATTVAPGATPVGAADGAAMPGQGGPGGAASTTGAGSDGTPGANYGAGGGGGGASRNGFNAGSGGRGAQGIVLVIEHY